jgi:hypothetical protein
LLRWSHPTFDAHAHHRSVRRELFPQPVELVLKLRPQSSVVDDDEILFVAGCRRSSPIVAAGQQSFAIEYCKLVMHVVPRSVDADIDASTSKTLDVGSSVERFVIVSDDSHRDFATVSVQDRRRDSIISDREDADVDGVPRRFQQTRNPLPAMIAGAEDDFRIGRWLVRCSRLADDL